MDHYKWSLRAGAAMILCAFLLRLTATGFFMPMVQLLTKPNIASIIIYLETGRVVRFSDSLGDSTGFVPVFYQTPAVTEPLEQETVPVETPVFTAAEAKEVEILGTERTYDAGALMEQPLDWDLTGPEPTVLILHKNHQITLHSTSCHIKFLPYYIREANSLAIAKYSLVPLERLS